MTIFSGITEFNITDDIYRAYSIDRRINGDVNNKIYTGKIYLKLKNLNLKSCIDKKLKYFKLITYSRHENSANFNTYKTYLLNSGTDDNVSSNNSLDSNSEFNIGNLKKNEDLFFSDLRISNPITKNLLENFSLKKTYYSSQIFDLSQYQINDGKFDIIFSLKDIEKENTSNVISNKIDFFIYAYDENDKIIDKYSLKEIDSSSIAERNISNSLYREEDLNWLTQNINNLFEISFPALDNTESKNLLQRQFQTRVLMFSRRLYIKKTNILKNYISSFNTNNQFITQYITELTLHEYLNDNFFLGSSWISDISNFLLGNNDDYELNFSYNFNTLRGNVLPLYPDNISTKYILKIKVRGNVETLQEKRYSVENRDPRGFSIRLYDNIKETKLVQNTNFSNILRFSIEMNTTFNAYEYYQPIITDVKYLNSSIPFNKIYLDDLKNNNVSRQGYINLSNTTSFFIDINDTAANSIYTGNLNFDITIINLKYRHARIDDSYQTATISFSINIDRNMFSKSLTITNENKNLSFLSNHTGNQYLYTLKNNNFAISDASLATGNTVSRDTLSQNNTSNILPENIKEFLFNQKTGINNFFLLIKKAIKINNNSTSLYEIIDITNDIVNGELQYSFIDDSSMTNLAENTVLYENISIKEIIFETKLLSFPIKYFTNEISANEVDKNIYDIVLSNNLQIMPAMSIITKIKRNLNKLNRKESLNQIEIAELYQYFAINESSASLQRTIQRARTEITTEQRNFNIPISLRQNEIDIKRNFINFLLKIDMSSFSNEAYINETILSQISQEIIKDKLISIKGLYFKNEQNEFIDLESLFKNIKSIPLDFLPWKSNDDNVIIDQINQFQSYSIVQKTNGIYDIDLKFNIRTLNKLVFLLSVINNNSNKHLKRYTNLKTRLYQKISTSGVKNFPITINPYKTINLNLNILSNSVELGMQEKLYIKYFNLSNIVDI